MLVVDASCLFEVVADTPRAGAVAARFAADVDQAAPHVVDVEVMGVIRSQYLLGRLDGTAAGQAVADLRDWPGGAFRASVAAGAGLGLAGFGAGMGRRLCGAGGGFRCNPPDDGRAIGSRAWADLQDRSTRYREMTVDDQRPR